VNDKPVKANYRLVFDDRVEVFMPEIKEPDIVPENIPLDILYEDKDVIVVNKPKQMVVHPAPGHYTGTLVNGLMYHCGSELSGINGVMRPGIVHRIDMDTTGIVVFAKDILTASKLGVEIKDHTFTRRYLCIASGKFIEDSGIYNYPIAENRYIANKKRVSPTGKEAITHYKIIKRLRKNLNLCLVELKTGRTHQIRVHFSYKGHPLVGDALYNGNTNLLKRQALHSYEVDFIHPIKNERVYVKCELPLDMRKIVEEYK
jgi:23S rRNA pseudouridine1911/1915/1917 synthase